MAAWNRQLDSFCCDWYAIWWPAGRSLYGFYFRLANFNHTWSSILSKRTDAASAFWIRSTSHGRMVGNYCHKRRSKYVIRSFDYLRIDSRKLYIGFRNILNSTRCQHSPSLHWNVHHLELSIKLDLCNLTCSSQNVNHIDTLRRTGLDRTRAVSS